MNFTNLDKKKAGIGEPLPHPASLHARTDIESVLNEVPVRASTSIENTTMHEPNHTTYNTRGSSFYISQEEIVKTKARRC